MARKLYLILVCIYSFAAYSNSTIEHFARKPQFEKVLISPTGDYLAVSMFHNNGKRIIGIINRNTMQFSSTINLKEDEMPGNFLWVNNERLVAQVFYNTENHALPSWYGNWFAMDANGDNKKVITHRRLYDEIGWPEIIDTIPNDPKHVLILNHDRKGYDSTYTTVLKLNVYTGRVRREAKVPIRGARVLTDENHEVRLAIGEDPSDKNKFKIFYREGKNTHWTLLNEFESLKGQLRPLSFASKNQIYLLGNINTNTTSLYKYDLKNKSSELIYNNNQVDLTETHISNGNLLAVRTDDGLPKLNFIDKENIISRWLYSLEEYFPNQFISLESITLDEKLFVVKVYSDVNPGEFYLVDTTKGKVDLLLSKMPWIKPQDMSEMQPIRFLSRDNLELNGYITLPKTSPENIPLVLIPHGGPHGIRDYWKFQRNVQFLASQGIAVLQVNFRGSKGYGNTFGYAGVGEWGGTMINDLIDATKWAMKKYPINHKQICVMGASYGAFAALMAAIKEPDIFKCVIAISGVYDLELHMKLSDTAYSMSGQNYLQDVLGNDKNTLRANSPIYHVNNLRAPLLLIHGENDRRTPIEQAEQLKSKLNEINHPLEWVTFEKEAHGIYKRENRETMFKKIQSFLQKHLNLTAS